MVNVDVSNSCFWHPVNFDGIAFGLSGESNQMTFQARCQRQPDGREPVLLPILKRLVKNKFFIKHRGSDGKLKRTLLLHSDIDFILETKIWTVKQISKFNAKDHKFDVTDKATGQVTNMSVQQYFMKKYNVNLIKPWLPLVQTQKPGVLFPMELCVMCEGQRYPYKLNSDQVWLTYTLIGEKSANFPKRLLG